MKSLDRILRLIETRNINQAILSKGTGIKEGNISDWKRGKANPSYGAIVKIAKYFNVSPEYLECKTDDPSPTMPTPQGEVIYNNKENKEVDEKHYVTKEELAEMLKANQAETIQAISELLKTHKTDNEIGSIQETNNDPSGSNNNDSEDHSS